MPTRGDAGAARAHRDADLVRTHADRTHTLSLSPRSFSLPASSRKLTPPLSQPSAWGLARHRFHDDEQAAPQDDAEYLATLKSLTNALHRRSHVEVRTIDHALSAALAAMSTGSTTAGGGSKHGTYTVTAHEPSADVVAPCLAWLRRLGAVGNKDADGQEREPAVPAESAEPVDVRVECLAANGEARWHTWPDDEHADTHAVVLVQLRTTGGDGVVGGASVHCEPERSSGGWPRVDDAPVLLESTPGEGAVFLHVFLVGTAPLRLRLDHVELLAIHVRWKGEGG